VSERDPDGTDQAPTPAPAFIQAATIASTAVVYAPTILTKSVLSNYHLQAAALFARQAKALEDEHAGKDWSIVGPTISPEHRAHVVGSIMLTVAYMEALINEIMSDAYDYPDGYSTVLNSADVAKIGAWWQRKKSKRAGILKKYQVALQCMHKQKFPEDEAPFQVVRDVIELQNELVHYKPEFLNAASPSSHGLERLDGKFPHNRLFPASTGNPFFPDKCLGHGCAEWCFNAALAFTSEFYNRSGLEPRHTPVTLSLATQ
jgi:hypothetical protein